MNKINFILSILWLAILGAIIALWIMGPKDVATDGPTEIAQVEADIILAEDDEPDEDYVPAAGLLDNAHLKTNEAGLNIIREYEGLELEAYGSPAGYHIGYGHGVDVTAGMVITEAEAEEFLIEDLVEVENAIKAAATLPLNENEFSALASLAYNIGTSAFWSSSTLTELNNGNRQGAADAFLLWNKASQGGQLVVNAKLTERREVERALFLKPIEDDMSEDGYGDSEDEE